jgi:ABC-type transport system substrate-binding protein
MLRRAVLVLLAALALGPVTRAESVLFQDTLRIRGFDPVRAADVSSAAAVARIYEPLYQYHYLDRPYRLEPLLAESMPEVSDDGLTYRFRIRPGIYFQDDPCFTATGGRGRAVTAHDFAYAIRRLADRRTQSTGYWTLAGRIEGLDAYRDATGGRVPPADDEPIAGVLTPDDHTLEVRLTRPYPQLMWILAMPYIVATPREAVEVYGDDFSRNPVGTGPFVLASWRPNYRIEYRRNPKWAETGRIERFPASASDPAAWPDAGRQLPLLDRIVDRVVMDPATRWLMFMTGQLDRADVARDNWDAVLDDRLRLNPELAARGVQLAVGPSLRLGYFAFNMEDPLLGANKALRQAMTCAFDTEAWIALFNGRITRPTGPIPDGLAGHDPDHAPFPFDLDRARRLMVEAGFPEGRDPATGRRLQITLELGRADDAELRQSVELFTHFMGRIGIQIVASYNNGPAFYEKLERRQAPMFFLSWIGDYPDAENFLQLFYGPNASPGPNRCNYRNPEFDALYDRIRVMPDSPERTGLYRDMAEIVVEDCPWIFAYQYLNVALRRPGFGNFTLHAFPYGAEKYYRLDPSPPGWGRR